MERRYKYDEVLLDEVNKTDIQKDSVSFWNLGQAGILIKGRQEDGMICVDPYLTNSIEKNDPLTEFKRAFSPVLSPHKLRGVNAILATHGHDDHLDLETIKAMAEVSAEMKCVVPAPLVSILQKELIDESNILSSRDGETIFINGIKVTPIPAAHPEYQLDSNGDHLCLGYLIDVNGIRLYHSGDTHVTSELLEKVKDFKPHVAFLPINGGDYFRADREIVGNMSFREAADFSYAMGADLIIPIHYDLFPNNRENPAYFVDYLFHEYPSQKFHMMTAGERFIYHK